MDSIKFLSKDCGTLEATEKERFNVENSFKGWGTNIRSNSNDWGEGLFLDFV